MTLLVTLAILLAPAMVRSQTQVPSGSPTQAPSTEVNVDVPATNLNVSGCASPNALIQIFMDNTLIAATSANKQGRFSKRITIDNGQAGLNTFKFYYQDINNRTSSINKKVINLSSQNDTAIDLLLPTTIEHEPEPVKAGDYLIFRGSTCPGALVNVKLDNNLTLAAKADSKGNWYVIANTEGYHSGRHVYEALSNIGNVTSQFTQKYQFNISGGSDQTGASPVDLSPPVITEPANPFLSSANNTTIHGQGPANSQIEIFVDGTLTGSVFTNAFGQWSFTLTMTGIEHDVTARTCWRTSCGEFSNTLHIQDAGTVPFCETENRHLEATRPNQQSVLAESDTDITQAACACSLNITLADYRYFNVKEGSGIDLKSKVFSGSNEYEVTLDWGDSSVEHFTLDSDQTNSWHHVYSHQGHYNGVLTVTGSEDCQQIRYFSVLVGNVAQPNWWMLGIIPLAGSLVYLISSFVNAYQNGRRWFDFTGKENVPPRWPSSRPWPKPTYGAGNEESKKESEQEDRPV